MEVWLGRTWPSSSIFNSSLHPLKACAAQTGCTSGAPRHRICRETSKNLDGWRSGAPFSSCTLRQDTPRTLPHMHRPVPMSFHRS